MPPSQPTQRRASAAATESASPPRNIIGRAWDSVSLHARKHLGVGLICAVAYFDPGNWSTDLQAGSQFGYKLLFVVLVSGIGAVILQVLACKLGCVTGLDLAAHCRLLLHDHPRYPRLVRRVFLYPLYALSELAIISTDLAELLGSAIGIVLLFPKVPLPVAVLLTASDVIIILAIKDPSRGNGRPVRVFEFIIIILVLVVFASFIVLIAKVEPHWPSVFEGYLPSRTLVQPSAMYAGIGILGATVMPHALYLGSYLATQDRVSSAPRFLPAPPQADRRPSLIRTLKSLFAIRRTMDTGSGPEDANILHGERDNNPLSFVKAHLSHGIVDIVYSLLGFAVVINSAILVLAGAVFFFGPGQTMAGSAADLFDAHHLIQDLIGKPAAVIFALALVCAGQSASITATLAGQIVSEGFIQWSVSPVFRRLITRLIGLVPAMIVAVVVGRRGISNLLIISQVILSVVLPFVMFPLIWLTSSSLVMRVKRPRDLTIVIAEPPSTTEAQEKIQTESAKESKEEICEVKDAVKDASPIPSSSSDKKDENEKEEKSIQEIDVERAESRPCDDTRVQWAEDLEEWVDYSNGWTLTIISYCIWLVVVVANGYLLVTLALN